MKAKPCTVAKRHKWVFDKNVERRYATPTTVRISFKGRYKCECGAVIYGEQQ